VNLYSAYHLSVCGCQPVAGGELQASVCPASVDRLPVVPSRAQTVTNNLAFVSGGGSSMTVKDINVRGAAGSMEGVETVRVTDMTSSSAFTKSIGSLFSTINKSVSSAFNSLMAVPTAAPTPATSDVLRTTAGTPTVPSQATPVRSAQHSELELTAGLHQQRYHQQTDLADWRATQPQSYAEPSASYRGNIV